MTQTCSLIGFPSASVSSAWMNAIFLPSGRVGRVVIEAARPVARAARQRREVAAGPRVHDVDLVVRVAALGAVEDDPPAVRAVVGERRVAAEVGDGVLVVAVLVHRPDLEGAGPVAAEGDVPAVGRVRRAGVEARVGGQAPDVIAVRPGRVDVVVAVGPGHREREPADVARIGGCHRADQRCTERQGGTDRQGGAMLAIHRDPCPSCYPEPVDRSAPDDGSARRRLAAHRRSCPGGWTGCAKQRRRIHETAHNAPDAGRSPASGGGRVACIAGGEGGRRPWMAPPPPRCPMLLTAGPRPTASGRSSGCSATSRSAAATAPRRSADRSSGPCSRSCCSTRARSSRPNAWSTPSGATSRRPPRRPSSTATSASCARRSRRRPRP